MLILKRVGKLPSSNFGRRKILREIEVEDSKISELGALGQI